MNKATPRDYRNFYESIGFRVTQKGKISGCIRSGKVERFDEKIVSKRLNLKKGQRIND